jgi:catechol 2,3-dioxygenase-like lactoylglutathione lyase family enzyme
MLLSDAHAATMIRVVDLDRAKKFYNETLGLKVVETGPKEVICEAGGGSTIGLYQGEQSKAEHTVACFNVPNIEASIKELEANGVVFDDYDFPDLKTVNHVAIDGNRKAAWFKDPDGNYLGLNQVI